jgi:hypothetical protein
MWRYSSLMNAWQKRITSASLLPFGSKSEPPLPPPMGSEVREFLKVCSKARNFKHAQVHRRVEAQAALVRADGAVHLDAETAIDLDLALIIDPRHAKHDRALRLADALQDAGVR